MTSIQRLSILAALSATLSGCATGAPLNKHFGEALREDLRAQIADPDARYKGDPDPGSNGERVGLAQERYRTGKVITPVAAASAIGEAGEKSGN